MVVKRFTKNEIAKRKQESKLKKENELKKKYIDNINRRNSSSDKFSKEIIFLHKQEKSAEKIAQLLKCDLQYVVEEITRHYEGCTMHTPWRRITRLGIMQ